MDGMLEIGGIGPDFSLIGTDGLIHTLQEFRGSRGIVVFFTCNQCPYVLGSEEYLMHLANEYYRRGVAFVGINPKSADQYPEESYENMILRDQEKHFPWVYLHDRSGQTAKRYGALATPHFFLLNHNRHLVYKGQALDNPRAPHLAKADHLKRAIDELLDGMAISLPVTDPIGCDLSQVVLYK